MAAGEGPSVQIRQLLLSWVAGVVTLFGAGASLGVAALGATNVGSGVMWAAVLAASALAGAVSVLVLRAPGTNVGDWLQAGLPAPAVAGTYVMAVGVQTRGVSLVAAAALVLLVAMLLAAGGGAVLGGQVKRRWGRRRGRA